MIKHAKVRPISIVVAALGGQGGGVLAQWIVDMAEANGYLAQSTSVPGVAQRTGATIYFVELFPKDASDAAGKSPILGLMPVPGDVDICIASELAEAGRSIMRGFVSPGLTTLVASSHRIYAIAEKETPGDGRIEVQEIQDAARKAAKKLVMFDMDKAAADTGSVISAILFGGLAGSGALPFSRENFEQTIHKTGKAVESNLKGFARGFDEAEGTHVAEVVASPAPVTPSPVSLKDRIAAFPEAVQGVVTEGVNRLADYQDRKYAAFYLDRLDAIVAANTISDADHKLLRETARYLALWMGFEDVIRVADFKTRAGRMDKIADEVRAQPGQYFSVVEYFHPRYEEFCDTLPSFIGAPLANSKVMQKLLGRFFSEGRNLTTTSFSGFLPLYFLASMRRLRRTTRRFKHENALIENWLTQVKNVAGQDYDLAVELAQCPRLIKGYGDTHSRGYERFSKIMGAVPTLQASGEGAARVRALRETALAAEDGHAFEEALPRAS